MRLGAEMDARGVDDRRMSIETAKCTVCRQPLGENGRCPHCDEDIHRIWTIEDWRPLLTLGLAIVLGFSFTSLVVTAFNDKQNALAAEYYHRGLQALEAKHGSAAVGDFEAALVYSHDNFQYGLKLTDALAASGATGEALAQLRAFREQRPGDAQVNLKLARLEAQRQHVDDAVRYYQNAFEGSWPEGSDPVLQRIGTRFESADYLVRQGRKEQAGQLLLALAAALPATSPEQGRLGDLLLRNGDPAEALKVYETALQPCRAERRSRIIIEGGVAEEPHLKPFVSGDEGRNARCQSALLGAAKASFAAIGYERARRFLAEIQPQTAESQGLELELERMEALDPFAPGATGKIRAERSVAAFHLAVQRLAGCGVPFAQALSRGEKSAKAEEPEEWSGLAKWASQLSPMMSERKLQGRDDVIESTMRFAFQAEEAAQKSCGKASLNDEALLLLARERLGAKP
jgi:predicted negative regulator of RcsB-dependent stress response